MNVKRYIIFLIIPLSYISCGDLSTNKSLKLAHGLDTSHPVHKGMDYMAERLKEKSGGKLTIEIYPSQQLGTERQSLELLQIGSIAMTKVSSAVLENFAPNMQVFSIPYVFRNREHYYKVQDGEIGQRLLNQGEQYWLKGLTYFDAGYRSFYSKEPIYTPEDIQDKKFRVQESVTAMNLVRSLGGAPTPISWGELYTALQQGVVDGAENNPPSFYLSRHYEVCKYYTLNEHTAVPDILVIGTIAWNNLNPKEQQWLQEAVSEATSFQRDLWQEAEQEAFDAVIRSGVEIIRPDKSLFAAQTKAMIDDYKEDAEKYALIQDIIKVK
jgi:tripartite ATP-independent transporter DctP family solute receptor